MPDWGFVYNSKKKVNCVVNSHTITCVCKGVYGVTFDSEISEVNNFLFLSFHGLQFEYEAHEYAI